MKAKLGIAPIAWSNDDLPELGGETTLDTCLRESKLSGFTGVETGGKFPKTPEELSPILKKMAIFKNISFFLHVFLICRTCPYLFVSDIFFIR